MLLTSACMSPRDRRCSSARTVRWSGWHPLPPSAAPAAPVQPLPPSRVLPLPLSPPLLLLLLLLLPPPLPSLLLLLLAPVSLLLPPQAHRASSSITACSCSSGTMRSAELNSLVRRWCRSSACSLPVSPAEGAAEGRSLLGSRLTPWAEPGTQHEGRGGRHLPHRPW